MKKCFIATGKTVNKVFAADFIEKNVYDFVIAADAGLTWLKSLNVIPDIIVGDLDTVSQDIVNSYKEISGIQWKLYKPEKNETDTELAVNTAIEMGADEITVFGATGGRLDHEIGNIQLMYSCINMNVRMYIYDACNKLYAINKKTKFNKNKLFGKYISFLPLTEKIDNITLSGFKYPLNNKSIVMGTSLCISNELVEDSGSIEFESGVILCVESND